MLTQYIQAAMKRAKYKIIDDGTFFGEIEGLSGVWANAETLEECPSELQEVLEEWLLLRLRDNENVPEIEGVALKSKSVPV